MATPSIRVLVVDDFEPFRRTLCSFLKDNLDLRAILESPDGEEAVELVQACRIDLILLDIRLPKLNGIEAARRIQEVSPQSKILFISQESSVDVVQAAFTAGASGYVVKMDAGRELEAAVKAVLRGERFVGPRFAGHGFTGPSDVCTPESAPRFGSLELPEPQKIGTAHRHEAGFYSNDASLLDSFTQFAGGALQDGNAVIVLATEAHRSGLITRLQAQGLDITAAIEHGRYLALDAAETLSKFMVDNLPDPVRLLKAASELMMAAAKSAGKGRRVAVCGETASLLWSQGKAEAAIRLEQLWGELARTYDLDTLCAYPRASFQGVVGGNMFEKICTEHSAIHSR